MDNDRDAGSESKSDLVAEEIYRDMNQLFAENGFDVDYRTPNQPAPFEDFVGIM